MSRSFSSVSSVLEDSDLEQQQSGTASEPNANYDDEQFDSQSEDEGESVVSVAQVAVFDSSSSDNYGSDDFEDEQVQASDASFREVSVSGDVENSGDYDDESFEGEEEATALGVQQGDISQATEEEDEYVDESFEGEEVTYEGEDLGVQGDSSQASNEESYYDDESFEGQETSGELEVAATLGAQGSSQRDCLQCSKEANEYDDESFEGEEANGEHGVAASLGVQDISSSTSDENGYTDESFEGEGTIDSQNGENQQDGTPLDAQVVLETDLYPELRDWCFYKIQELKTSGSKPKSARSSVRQSRIVVCKIPAAAVKELIHRASSGRPSRRQRQQVGNSQLRSRQRLKMPTSLMERAQTQQCLAKRSHSPEPPPAPTRAKESTFYSVKCDVLRGRLATMRLYEAPGPAEPGDFSLETLAWVQQVAVKQREVANRATEDFKVTRLFEVKMATRLQLENSIALRKQAATLLAKTTT